MRGIGQEGMNGRKNGDIRLNFLAMTFVGAMNFPTQKSFFHLPRFVFGGKVVDRNWGAEGRGDGKEAQK
jgi:hypothetical protein